MVEDKKVDDNKEGAKEVKTEGAEGDPEEGVLSETAKATEVLKAETDELNKQIAEKANADARAQIAGVTTISPKEEKEEITPEDYVKQVMENKLPEE